MTKRRNVLLVVFDQFRGDLIEGALARAVHLPNLQRFRKTATTFLRHYSVAAPCGPARASLFTGQYAMNHRAVRNGTPLRHDTPNLATELRHAGYDPVLFGYTDIARDPRALAPDDPRLSSYEEVLPGFTEALRLRLETDVTAWTDHLASKGYAVPDSACLYHPLHGKLGGTAFYRAEDSDTAFLADKTLAWLDGAAPGWAATVCFIRPHPPLVAPAPYHAMFDPIEMPPPAVSTDPEGHPYLGPARARTPIASVVDGVSEVTDTLETVAQIRAIYAGLAAEVDHHFGRLVAWLDATDQAQDTVVIVTADHGEMLGDHGLWGKASFHDATFHVPLMLRDPARPEALGMDVTAMTESIDVMPTILDLAGLPVPDTVDGMSLGPLLAPGVLWPRTEGMSELDFGDPVAPTLPQSALGLSAREASFAVLRTDRHRLVHFTADLPQILFDMENEDGEGSDISRNAGGEALAARLTRRLLSHRMRHADGTFARTMIAGGVQTGNH